MAPANSADCAAAPPDPASLPKPAHLAVFIDIDGTLLGFRERPEQVRLHDALRGTLRRLCRKLDGAVALISGRTLADIDRIFHPLGLPAAGLHGLEWRLPDGTRQDSSEAAVLDHLRPELKLLVERYQGVLLEDKGSAVALHYRGVPDIGPNLVARVRDLVAADADTLTILDGKMVVEVKPRHADKGSAIAAFLAEAPFAGRVPVFLGDDATDEDGFRTVNQRSGISVLVDGQDGGKRETAARYRLPDESAVERWLEGLVARLDAVGDHEDGTRRV